MFEFSADYKVGIELIDKEHQGLFDLLNNAILSLDQRRAAPREIAADFLENLKTYALEHFTHEEAYMKKIGDGELSRQREEHADFTASLEHFYADEHTKEADVRELINYVVKWLFSHILASDMMIGKVHTGITADEIIFSEEYMTYIDFVDEEHRTLFEIIKETNDLVTDNIMYDEYDEIIAVLDKLKKFAKTHFEHEEEYMEKIGYPKLDVQKMAHHAFIEKLSHLDLVHTKTVDEEQQKYLSDIVEYLLGWLTLHIKDMDRQIGEWERGQ